MLIKTSVHIIFVALIHISGLHDLLNAADQLGTCGSNNLNAKNFHLFFSWSVSCSVWMWLLMTFLRLGIKDSTAGLYLSDNNHDNLRNLL